MSSRGSISVVRAKVNYPEHLLSLNDMLDFIYEDGFWDDWSGLGLDHDRDLSAFEIMLTANPTAGQVIPGTGHLRKTRWGRQERGKRGGVRIVYMYIPEIFIVYLFFVYGKSELEDISNSSIRELRARSKSIRTRLLKTYQKNRRASHDGEKDES